MRPGPEPVRVKISRRWRGGGDTASARKRARSRGPAPRRRRGRGAATARSGGAAAVARSWLHCCDACDAGPNQECSVIFFRALAFSAAQRFRAARFWRARVARDAARCVCLVQSFVAFARFAPRLWESGVAFWSSPVLRRRPCVFFVRCRAFRAQLAASNYQANEPLRSVLKRPAIRVLL